MLKKISIERIVLLVFSFLMFEVLTASTLAFVIGGLLTVSLNIKTTKLIRNILALGVFASYWFVYGKIIDPEVGLNFLTSIIVLKILEKETVRDRYMIFFGLLLLISAGSLFEKTLTYVLFFGVSFLFLIQDFYSYLGQKWRLKDLGYALLWVFPLTFFLFFFVPRLLNPIPFQQGQAGPGELGYTPDVNISQIESLASNETPVFQVLVSQKLNQGQLYWRGNTLSYNDGWNWVKMSRDIEEPEMLLGAGPASYEITQKFRLFNRSDFFFALDFPRVVNYGKNILGLGHMRTLPQKRWEWVPRYEAISAPGNIITQDAPANHYLQVPLSRKEKNLIQETFPGSTLEEVQAGIRSHFLKEGFQYSLSPGRSLNFREFMNRKIGFCSHYASATALIMRTKGIPTRLVSGFMGGDYNRYADFYLISQNDAHVWVEAWSKNGWVRLDPTEWIAPDRLNLGGQAFMENVQDGAFKRNSRLRLPGFIQDFRMWFGQWDFKFYQWLEEMDYHTQEAWFSKWNFKREWLFSILPLIMVIFMSVYIWFLKKQTQKKNASPVHELWAKFMQKLEKRGLMIDPHSLKKSEAIIRKSDRPDKERILSIWNDLVTLSYKNQELSKSEILKKIRQL